MTERDWGSPSTIHALKAYLVGLSEDEMRAIHGRFHEVQDAVNGSDVVFCPVYQGVTTGLLMITTSLQKAVRRANKNNGFPVYMYKDGLLAMDSFYSGESKRFFNGLLFGEYLAYSLYHRSSCTL